VAVDLLKELLRLGAVGEGVALREALDEVSEVAAHPGKATHFHREKLVEIGCIRVELCIHRRFHGREHLLLALRGIIIAQSRVYEWGGARPAGVEGSTKGPEGIVLDSDEIVDIQGLLVQAHVCHEPGVLLGLAIDRPGDEELDMSVALPSLSAFPCGDRWGSCGAAR